MQATLHKQFGEYFIIREVEDLSCITHDFIFFLKQEKQLRISELLSKPFENINRMKIDIIVPSAGESISQVELARWLVSDGVWVEKGQDIAEIDSDKATLSISANQSGLITITVEEGTTLAPGITIGVIDTSVTAPESKKNHLTDSTDKEVIATKPQTSVHKAVSPEITQKTDKDISAQEIIISPQARRLLDQQSIKLPGHPPVKESRRITSRDILSAIGSKLLPVENQNSGFVHSDNQLTATPTRSESRQKMSTLRRKLAERLVAVKNQTAMLTSFQEVDMSAVLEIRKMYQQPFIEKYGIKPGLMSFFTKAVTIAIKDFPQINGRIEEDQLVLPEYVDVGIAVSTPKGLMVPVVRNAESLSYFEIELTISELAQKARTNKISIEELTGGTFSITNGGVFGSLLSTPLINPPQSAILGMHNITDRPVAIAGKVEIRPIMFLALSYDHRIIDGRESVGFLIRVKELIENPQKLLFGGKDPIQTLLGL